MRGYPVPIEHIKKVLAMPERLLPHSAFKIYMYGLLRSGIKHEFYLVRKDAEKYTGVNVQVVSDSVSALCDLKLFERTGKYHGKFPILRVALPKGKISKTPIPPTLRERIHQLSDPAFRLLVLLIVKGGWWHPLGCVVPYRSATRLAPEAGISESAANTAMQIELPEKGWIVREVPYGEWWTDFQSKAPGWNVDSLITVTQKAGFAESPQIPMQLRCRLVYALGALMEVYRPAPSVLVWRNIVRGALSRFAKGRK
jgi:hypothetical protein